ncbi:hypothetical protein HK104_002138 [Borealophlyctis nickersoniae]|nr:hypothetical protein HK104_002138 [Borealophlyctis nickersoniae]
MSSAAVNQPSNPANPHPAPSDTWAAHAKKAIDDSSSSSSQASEAANQAAQATKDKLASALSSAQDASERLQDAAGKAFDAAVGNTGERAQQVKAQLEQELAREQALAAAEEEKQRQETLKPVVEFFNQGKDPELLAAEREKALLEKS